MSFENEFDKIIKQKAQENAFPFDESNWEKAEHMIDAQRKSALVKSGSSSLLKVMGSIAIFGVLGVGAYLLISPNKKQSVIVNEKNIQVEKQNVQLESNENQMTDSNLPENQINKNITTTNNSTRQTISVLGDNEKNNHTLTQNQIVKRSEAITADNAQINTTNQTNTSFKADGNTINQYPAVKSQENQTIVSSNATNDLAANRKSELNVVSENSQDVSQEKENKEPYTPSLNSNGNNNLMLESEKINADNIEAVLKQQQNQNNNKLEIEWLAQRKIVQSEFDTNIVERPINIINSYENNVPKSLKLKTNFLNIEAGLNYSNGWSALKGTDGRGLNYFAGFNYGFYISKKLILGAGLNYYNIQNIKQSFYTSQKTFYSFSSNNTYTSVTTNNLNYLSIPVKLYFDINQLHMLSVGALPSILIGAKNTVQVYNLVDEQKVNIQSTSNKALYKGVAQKYMQLSFGYRAKLGSRLWLDTEVLYGLTDLFENTSSNSIAQNPIGLRLGLQFNIFDK